MLPSIPWHSAKTRSLNAIPNTLPNSMSLEPKSTPGRGLPDPCSFLEAACSPPSCHQYLASVYFLQGSLPEAPWVTPVAEEVTEGLIWGPQDFYPTSDCSPEQEGAAAQSLGEYALRTSHWWGLAKATGIANPSLNPGSHIDGKEMKGKGLHWTLTRK